MTDAFYEPLGNNRYASTTHTSGPWDEGAQHGGPPSALLGGLLAATGDPTATQAVRVTTEILGPIPVTELTARTWISRAGRSVELVEGELSAGGRAVLRGSAWRIRTALLDLAPPPPGVAVAPPLPGADAARPAPWAGGYLGAVEWRWASGEFARPGPAAVWTRLRVDLVAGAPTTPLQRVLAVADSGSGVSSVLDIADWIFINPELTVHVHRMPVGDWVCLDATSTVEPHGVGLATSVLSDQLGPVARGAQALYVTPR